MSDKPSIAEIEGMIEAGQNPTLNPDGTITTEKLTIHDLENVLLKEEVATLKAELLKREWISVDDPPKESGYYFGFEIFDGEKCTGTYEYYASGNMWEDSMNNESDVTHWMPLPEPPTV